MRKQRKQTSPHGMFGLVLLCFLGLSTTAKATSITMTDWSQAVGLSALVGPSFTPGWLDIDMDGEDEPFWLCHTGLWYLNHNDSGEVVLELATVEGLTDPAFFVAPEGQAVLARGDFDRDGFEDLWVFEKVARLYRVDQPGHLTEMDVNVPWLPLGPFTSDAAVGDLNADGWPDVVLAQGRTGDEHFYQLGAPDLILMNLGGHFERIPLEPSMVKQTGGLTLADMDGDGRLDVVESITFSQASGYGRILLNRTPPGELTPTFEVSSHTFDRGAQGMGAAIQDIDQDGFLDIFHSSSGQDFVIMGNPDGSFTDKTWALGVSHEWGTEGGPRIQWAPSIVDMNADGLLDLYERHGHRPELMKAFFGVPPKAQMNLIYAQEEDGTFARITVPHDPNPLYNGDDGAWGDFDGDGLPEVVMGGMFIAGSANSLGLPIMWHNDTTKPPSSRSVAVVLAPSVSANPPTGAWVEGFCGPQRWVRHLHTGGLMGAISSWDLLFSWLNCSDDIEFTVHWPSGAESHVFPSADGTRVVAQEPNWSSLEVADGGGLQVTLDPTGTGHSTACYRPELGADWTCCDVDEAPCLYAYNPGAGEFGIVRLGTQGPELALQPLAGWHTLRTTPALPAPGEDVLIEVFHGGIPESFGLADVWLRVEDQKADLEVDEERRVKTVLVPGKEPGETINLSLFQGIQVTHTWPLPNGNALDERWVEPSLYPNQNLITERPWRLYLTSKPHHPNQDIVKLNTINVRTGDGVILPAVVTRDHTGRIHIDVTWDAFPVGAKLAVYEDDVLRAGPFPTYHLPDVASVGERLHEARGFITRIMPVESGDITRIIMTLYDAEGHPMPPRTELLEVVLDGLVIETDWTTQLGFGGGWDLSMVFRSKPGVGAASVAVRLKGGKELGRWDLERRAGRAVTFSPELTTTTLSQSVLPAGVGASATVKVLPRDALGELIGYDAQVEVQGPPEIWVGPCEINEAGIFACAIEPGYYGGKFSLSVFVDGTLVGMHPLEVVGAAPPEVSVNNVNWPGDDATAPGDDNSAQPVDHPPDVDSCSTHSTPRATLCFLVWFLVVGLLRRNRPRPTG